KRILLNNIYGVDIDVNAVEVTKLSLLLKCMEGETNASIANQFTMFHERVLPSLENNIKCGNSLISTDYLKDNLFEVDKKIKPFDWEKAFPEVFNRKIAKKEDDLKAIAGKAKEHAQKAMEYASELENKLSAFGEPDSDYYNGGFDVVIGNPPWVSLNGKFGNDILNPQAQQYLISKYQGNTYMPNLYEYFVHKGLELINSNGLFSFIVPDRLGFNNQFVSLRKKILQHYQVEELLYKAPFPGIVTDTLIFRFSNKKKSEDTYKINVGEFGKETQTKTNKEYLHDPEYQFLYESSDNASKILNKIFSSKKCKPLGDIAETTSGFGGKSTEITDIRKNQKQIKVIRGRSIQKFSNVTPYYFEFKKENITGRTTDQKKLGAKEKVLLRKTGYPIIATYDESGIYPEQSLYFIFNNKSKNSLKYFTALINSKLFQFVYINRLVTNKDSTPQLKKVDLDKFPVLVCDVENQTEKIKHDEIVKLVDLLLKLNLEKQTTKLQSNIEQLQTRIDYCEDEINKLVYELYGIKKDEIKIVEGK
ncbi:MAG: TaqI-like C-terminal specificity domain-containing protein, partial [Bacteroidales bacterium]